MTLTEFLESVRCVEVRLHRLVNDALVGLYQSRFKWRGIEFEKSGNYGESVIINSVEFKGIEGQNN